MIVNEFPLQYNQMLKISNRYALTIGHHITEPNIQKNWERLKSVTCVHKLSYRIPYDKIMIW